MLRLHYLSIEKFVGILEKDSAFTFARYGDGSFQCLQGKKGKNCDGVFYTEAQANALLASIQDDTINHAIGILALKTTGAEEWLISKEINIEWYDCDVMNSASDDGKLLPFIEWLRTKKIIFCGPGHLKKLKSFPIQYFVECHPIKAFEEVNELEDEILYRIDEKGADMVLLSAGSFASPALVSKLHNLFPKNLTILDTGSIWDPYVGVFSRSGHKRRGWEGYKKLGWLNFNENIENW